MDLLGGLGVLAGGAALLSMSSQRCGAARSDFFYDICFYVVCGTACRTHFKVWTQLFAPSRDTPRAPCLLRTDKILLVGVLVLSLSVGHYM